MSVQILSQNAAPGKQVKFNFSAEVVSYVIGISYWYFEYDKSDHQTKEISLNIDSSSNGDVVYATPKAVLSGQGHGLNSSSTVNMSCIAVLKEAESDLVLASLPGLANGSKSTPITTPVPSSIDAGVVNGWYAEYGAGHHVKTFQTSVQTIVNGSLTTLESTMVMKDNTGHSASNPTLDAGLIASSSPELIAGYLQQEQTGSPLQVSFPGVSNLSSVGVMLQSLTVSYGTNTDHDIKFIGGGTTGWTVNGNTVTLNNAQGLMSDGKHNQDSSLSSVSLIVLAVPA